MENGCEDCAYGKGRKVIDEVVASTKSLFSAWGSSCSVKLSQKFPKLCALEGSAQYDYQRREFLLGLRTAAKNSGEDAAAYMIQKTVLAKEEKPLYEHVTADGTLPHHRPAARTQLLGALEELGSPRDAVVHTRLWRRVLIDQGLCNGCQMCAVFCPSAALAKHVEIDEEASSKPMKLFRAEGNPRAASAQQPPSKPVTKRHAAKSASSSFATGEKVDLIHAPSMCVGCGTCEQLCPKHAIRLCDDVNATELFQGYTRTLELKDIFLEKGGPDAIKNSMSKLIDSPYIWG